VGGPRFKPGFGPVTFASARHCVFFFGDHRQYAASLFCVHILAAALGKVLVDQDLWFFFHVQNDGWSGGVTSCKGETWARTDRISFVLVSACISFTLFRCLLDCSMLLVYFSSLLHSWASDNRLNADRIFFKKEESRLSWRSIQLIESTGRTQGL
jgi:hypothetical protein